MATNHVVQDGSIGIDLNYIGSARTFGLGQTVKGDGGSEFMYVLFNSAVNQGGLTKIEAGYLGSACTGANETTSMNRLGFAQTTFAASQYGFLALAGQNVLVRTLGGAAFKGEALYTTSTLGAMSTATASSTEFQVWGVYLQSSVSATAATATVSTAAVSYPFLRKPKL
ncbi:MAG: hypothetical protein NUV51_03890 [Sulfuricaulis sp.]|nr:hypothetical protein [Sulfuricaulis sp.]